MKTLTVTTIQRSSSWTEWRPWQSIDSLHSGCIHVQCPKMEGDPIMMDWNSSLIQLSCFCLVDSLYSHSVPSIASIYRCSTNKIRPEIATRILDSSLCDIWYHQTTCNNQSPFCGKFGMFDPKRRFAMNSSGVWNIIWLLSGVIWPRRRIDVEIEFDQSSWSTQYCRGW